MSASTDSKVVNKSHQAATIVSTARRGMGFILSCEASSHVGCIHLNLPIITTYKEATWALRSAEFKWHSTQKGESRAWLTSRPSKDLADTSSFLPAILLFPALLRYNSLRSFLKSVREKQGGGHKRGWITCDSVQTHYTNYLHQNHAGQICSYLQVIFRVSFAVIVRTSFWMLRVGWSREINKPAKTCVKPLKSTQ